MEHNSSSTRRVMLRAHTHKNGKGTQHAAHTKKKKKKIRRNKSCDLFLLVKTSSAHSDVVAVVVFNDTKSTQWLRWWWRREKCKTFIHQLFARLLNWVSDAFECQKGTREKQGRREKKGTHIISPQVVKIPFMKKRCKTMGLFLVPSSLNALFDADKCRCQ